MDGIQGLRDVRRPLRSPCPITLQTGHHRDTQRIPRLPAEIGAQETTASSRRGVICHTPKPDAPGYQTTNTIFAPLHSPEGWVRPCAPSTDVFGCCSESASSLPGLEPNLPLPPPACRPDWSALLR